MPSRSSADEIIDGASSDPIHGEELAAADDISLPSKKKKKKNRKAKLAAKETRSSYKCRHCEAEFPSHLALGGHTSKRHPEKKNPALKPKGPSVERQGAVVVQSENGNVGKEDKQSDESSGLSPASTLVQGDDCGSPPVADGHQRRPVNIDLNVEASLGEEQRAREAFACS